MSARHISDRWPLTLPLVLPTMGGLCYLVSFEAPLRLIALNAGALIVGLAVLLWGRLPRKPEARLTFAAIATGLLFLPLVTGPDLNGVSRWLPAGPITLQSAPLLLPLIVVLSAQQKGKRGLIVLGCALIALALQPDAAGLAGLGMAGGALAWRHRSLASGLLAAIAIVLAGATIGAGALEPQLYTENVLAHIWHSAPLATAALGALLFGAAVWLPQRLAQIRRTEALALSAVMAGQAVIACLAPFPFPMIGYGTAPIIGFALGLLVAEQSNITRA